MKRFVLTLAMMASGLARAYAGTNFPALADYPAPSCVKVDKPDEVPPIKLGEDPAVYNKRINQHNDQVAHYNTALHDYTACMNDYVANAQADMDAIRVKVNKAVQASQVP